MKKLIPIIAFLLGLLLFAGTRNYSDKEVTINVGGLLSITGNWSTLGVTSKEAMNLAVKEINDRMKLTGSHYRFSITVYDTKLDPSLAEAAIREAYKNNIHFIVGPQSSAELKSISSFANENGILLVSQGSTAGSLAVPGDGIFRFCPADAVQGDAMAQAIYAQGHRAIITLTRDDAGNMELEKAVGAAFISRKGIVDETPPYAATTTDFSALLGTLKTKIQQRTAQLGAGKVCVYLASFDRAKELFHQASADPVFSSVRWYGGDGIALSNELISDARASSFAASAKFFAPRLGMPQQASPELASVAESIRSKTGTEADAYTLAVYDAMWVIARTVCAFPEPPDDFTKIKQIFQKEADQFCGITGPLNLNAAGDRGTGCFDFWGVINEEGTYKWKWVGKSS